MYIVNNLIPILTLENTTSEGLAVLAAADLPLHLVVVEAAPLDLGDYYSCYQYVV